MNDKISEVQILIEKASKAEKSEDAMRFSQAACNAANALCSAKSANPEPTEAQIKHMVDRFLQWKLPSDFSPDDGISFDRVANRGNQYESVRQPFGTNLFDATQATKMVRHMIDGMPT